jgi:tetratricopeptide (TPR) repeat protein
VVRSSTKADSPNTEWPIRIGQPPTIVHRFQERSHSTIAQWRKRDSRHRARTLIVAGFAGTGKTQLVASYVKAVKNSVDLLLWINASTQDAILTAYASAAQAIGVVHSTDIEEMAILFLDWLRETSRSWLVVLDGIEDPADLDRWRPSGHAGEVLITTRRRDMGQAAEDSEYMILGSFSSDEAFSYLTHNLQPWQRERELDVRSMAADLGLLPLALSQAAAYMKARRLTCVEYRELLSATMAVFNDGPRPEYHRSTDGHDAILDGAWALSVSAVDLLEPVGMASRMLELLSVMDSSGVPREVVSCDSSLRYLRSESRPATADDALIVLGNLERFSLASSRIEADRDRGSVLTKTAIHALVQRSTFESLTSNDRLRLVRTGADALLQSWPVEDYRPENFEKTASFRANAEALIVRSGDLIWVPDGHALLGTVGLSLKGFPHQAVAFWKRAAADAERILGHSHTDTIATRNNLAQALQRAGRIDEAIPLAEAARDGFEVLLGHFHRDTLTAVNNLAMAYLSAGRLDQARLLLEETLKDRRMLLGSDDADTLKSVNNLGLALRDAGDVRHAISLFEEALRGRERVLGASHPDTLASRNDLALTYQNAGRLEEATPLLEANLYDRERLLGPDHPSTLASRNNIAAAYVATGRFREAIPLLENTIRDAERLLGPNHPNNLQSQNTLALAYQAAGRLDDAIALFEANLDERRHLLGSCHPDTLTSLMNLAGAYRSVGRRSEAISMLTNVLSARAQLLGVAHPTTVLTRATLSDAISESANPPEGEPDSDRA